MKRLIVLLFPITVLFVACGEDSGTNSSGGGEYVLQYPDESAMLALVESREFRPPKSLQIQIDRELTAIREQWGDSIPEVLLEYRDPWEGWIGLVLRVDTTIMRDTLSPSRIELDSLLAHFGADLLKSESILPDVWGVYPHENWYPPAAVDSFSGLSGVRYLQTTVAGVTEGYYSSVRNVSDSGTYWYVGSDCQWSMRFHVFKVSRHRAEFIHDFSYCYMPYDSAVQVWDSLGVPYSERSRIINEYRDSVMAEMPEWYRWARSEASRLVRGEHYNIWP